jgi:cytoskeleton protein RodZ
MSEVQVQPEEGLATGAELPNQPSAGEMLRMAREAAGLSLSELAVSLKVNVKKLEALEADRLNLLPNAVFVRGLASSVCRVLRIDAAPVLALLPQTATPQLIHDRERGLNTPFRSPADLGMTSIWDQLSRPVILAVLALLAGALVLIFFPSMERKGGAAPTPEQANPTVQRPADAEAESFAVAKGVDVSTAVAPNEASTEAAPAIKTPKPAAAPQPASNANSQQPMPVPAKASAVTGGGMVSFKANGPSWIEVTDAAGVVQLRRTLQTGDSARASGVLPLAVVVGSADVTEVLVKGKPFSLTGLTRDNVARFEVK